jgi:response regulator RpfG family c-di-GMP phosphodiesterase
VLQTAQSDLNAAISAINDSGVYRYLSKPIPTEELRATVRDAVDRSDRATAERQLLDKTLKASIQALFDVLQLASPVAFARGARIRALVADLCQQLQLQSHWEIEVAAMASQLGAVTIPPSVLQKLDKGLPCNEDEQVMVDAMPGVAVQLLRTIPMLGDVVEIVQALAVANRDKVRGLKVVELETGMRVAEDIVATNGLVLIGRGMTVTELLLDRLTNYARMIEIIEPVLAVPGARTY